MVSSQPDFRPACKLVLHGFCLFVCFLFCLAGWLNGRMVVFAFYFISFFTVVALGIVVVCLCVCFAIAFRK